MKEYEVTVNGVTTTLLLDDTDAKALSDRGYRRPDTKARKAVENK